MQNPAGNSSRTAFREVSDHHLLDDYLTRRAPDSFLRLVKRHSSLVYSTCLRITKNAHDAEELSQECFFDLASHADKVTTSVAGWLHQSATRRALNRLRSERRRKKREQEAAHRNGNFDSVSPSSESSWAEIEPIIDQVLMEIPEQLRVPMLMHYIEGVTQLDIATSIGVHQSTVSRRLSDGLSLLREKLRKAGILVTATILVGFLQSQTATAAPITLTSSLGKIGLAGIGVAKATCTSQFASTYGILKGVVSVLLFPFITGVIWGELAFLVLLAVTCLYIGMRRPEWFRVICYTKQYPNVYDWPFFPLKRWEWNTPPREWRIWMIASMILGGECFVVAVFSPMLCGPLPGRLLLMFTGAFGISLGARIWFRVRRFENTASEHRLEHDAPVDGALLLTYALACTVLFAKLCILPLTMSLFSIQDDSFWLITFYAIIWATILVFSTLLVSRRYRQWMAQSTIESGPRFQNGAPPRWLLGLLFMLPLSLALFITYLALLHDVRPVYVHHGSSVVSAYWRQTLTTTLLAMDCVVFALLPLSCLYCRIPRVAWGVGVSVLAVTCLTHIGILTTTLVAFPRLNVLPNYARGPLTEVVPNKFLISISKQTPNASGNVKSSYMGKTLIAGLRFTGSTKIVLSYGYQSATLEVPHDSKGLMAGTGVIAMVGVSPANFDAGVPSQLNVSLSIVDPLNRRNTTTGLQLPLPNSLSATEWRAQFELSELAVERSVRLGETVNLGTIHGSPLEITVQPGS